MVYHNASRLLLTHMPAITEEPLLPNFEIDHQKEFSKFFLSNRREVIFYLNIMAKRHCLFTAYINEGANFFLTTIVAVDEEKGLIFLDPQQDEAWNTELAGAAQITLVANLDSVKMQIRLPALKITRLDGTNVLSAPIPVRMLRLQRREFFRLEPPHSHPIHCKLASNNADGVVQTFDLPLADISGGGACLIGPVEIAEQFSRDALFQHCRLEIPGEGVIQVNLRVRKTVEISDRNAHHSLRIGCEFVNLSGARLAFIERYITRIERERKARDSGLAD